MKGPDGLCTDCGGTHDLWHAEDPAEWEYREGCLCHLCQEQERKMSRDTQFQGFAKLLVQEILTEMQYSTGRTIQDIEKGLEALIARAAHSLVGHTVGYSLEYLHECGHELSGGMGSRITPSIPDMTKLPKEQDASETTS